MAAAMASEWSDGSGYESYVGRWSRSVAREFLRWLAVEPGSTWLDFGCGTGALGRTVLEVGAPRLVIGCDRSPEYVAFARRQASDARAEFVVAELPDLPRVPGGFDAAVAGLVLNFLSAPGDGVAAMRDRVRTGGIVAAYVWDYAQGMQLLRVFWDAAVAQDAAAGALDEGARFPICRPEALQSLFENAGLCDVTVRPIVVPTVLQDFDDYWRPFLSRQGPAPAYVAGLSPERRERLREAIRERLPVAPDGTIALSARAWAVRGRAA